MALTTRFTRRHLPHWEVENGRYFVTVRCADSLPREATLRLAELHSGLSRIAPRSEEFASLQRQIFRTLEKYLDAGIGSCPLRRPDAANVLVEEFAALVDWKIDVPHYPVMPNHWHALVVPQPDCAHPLSAILKRIKGRSAKRIRAEVGGRGPFWQREWFDRWMRNEAEWDRCGAYIRNNPVKAGIVADWTQHPWTK